MSMQHSNHRPAWHRRVLVAASFLGLLAGWADDARAGRVNFAKYQVVTASSQSGDYEPGFATDGLVSNFHSFRTANTTAAQWLQITFPRTVTIASAHLYLGVDNDPAQGGLPGFKFQYHDGSAWVDVPGSTVTGNTATELSVIFSSAPPSDRFRLYTDEDGSRTIRELALFPPNLVGGVEQGYPIGTDVRLNLAYAHPAVGSTISSNGYPKLAVDGYVDDASRWLCAASPAGQTLEIDLLQHHAIGSAHVYSGAGTGSPLSSFSLQSWDGTAWQAIPGGTITGNTSTARVVPFSAPVTTPRLRLVNHSASVARVREMLVFPPRAGGYPPGQDILTTQPPAARWDDFSDSTWRLKNGGPDLRLGWVAGSVVNTNGLSGLDALNWQLLLNHRDGSYRLRHVATGNCLAQGEISTAAGKALVAEPYTGLPHQDWVLDYVNATQFRLINVYSGLSIAPAAYNWTAGTKLVTVASAATSVQYWQRSLVSHYPKKGLGGTGYGRFQASWFYHWGRSTSLDPPADTSFNPMQWGNYNWSHGSAAGPLDVIRNNLQSDPKPAHLMGFNEPDQTGQANMTVEQAIDYWPRLEAMDAPLIGPCPANTFGGWQDDFTTKADALGYRRDYTPYHSYVPPDADTVISNLQKTYTQFGRPVWLTEFSVVDWYGTGSWTHASNYNFLAEFMWRAESLPWLKRYALFQFTEGGTQDLPTSPKSNTWRLDGSMTPFGELYAGWDGVTSVLPDKSYHVHNRGEYERLRNPGTSSTAALADPSNSRLGSQWFLTPGLTANTYRIISTRDGRPLRSSGTALDLGTRGQTTTAVEWNLVADQDGWYFIEHPLSNKRLKANTNATFSMVADTTASDSVKWRFVVPVNPDSTVGAPSAVPQHVVMAEDAGPKAITLEGGDVEGNPLTYTIVTPPARGTLSGTLPNADYTPEADFSGNDSFTFRVNDGTLDSAPVTVTIRVTEVNDAPVAAPQSVTMTEGVTNKTITLAGTDAEGDPLSYSIVAGPANGTLGGTGRNRTYTPAADYHGTDSFTFRVNDGTIDSAPATVSITVNPVNDAPVATPQSVTTNEDTVLSITLAGTDIDGNPLSYSIVTQPAKGGLSGTGQNRTYTPNANYHGTDSFTFRVNDGTVNSAPATVSITINAVNDAPVLAAIPAKTVTQGATLTFTASATDVDLPANILTYSQIGAPAGASIHAATGVFSWTPSAAQSPGSFNFTLRVSDGSLTHDRPVAVDVSNPLPNPGTDTDRDGLSDLLEFAFLTDPAMANGSPFRITGVNAGTVTLEFPWNWRATGLRWQIRQGPDLSNPAAWPVVNPGTPTVTREGDIDRIRVSPVLANPKRGFLILEVLPN